MYNCLCTVLLCKWKFVLFCKCFTKLELLCASVACFSLFLLVFTTLVREIKKIEII